MSEIKYAAWSTIPRLPCPFCGGTKVDVVTYTEQDNFAQCEQQGCHVQGPRGDTPEAAVARWNERTSATIGHQE